MLFGIIGKNNGKPVEKTADKPVAPLEKYKQLALPEQASFRKKLGKGIEQSDGDREKRLELMKLAAEIGAATTWDNEHLDFNVIDPLVNIVLGQEGVITPESADIKIAAIQALYNLEYGEIEFWQNMIHAEGKVAVVAIEKMIKAEGGEELLLENAETVVRAMHESKEAGAFLLKNFDKLKPEARGEILASFIDGGVPPEMVSLVSKLADYEETVVGVMITAFNDKLRPYLAGVTDENVEKTFNSALSDERTALLNKLPLIMAKTEKDDLFVLRNELAKCGIVILPSDVQELVDILVDNNSYELLRVQASALLANGVNDEIKQRIVAGMAKMIEEHLKYPKVENQEEACRLGTFMLNINKEKGVEMLKLVYEEVKDVMADENAATELRISATAAAARIEQILGIKTPEDQAAIEKYSAYRLSPETGNHS